VESEKWEIGGGKKKKTLHCQPTPRRKTMSAEGQTICNGNGTIKGKKKKLSRYGTVREKDEKRESIRINAA